MKIIRSITVVYSEYKVINKEAVNKSNKKAEKR